MIYCSTAIKIYLGDNLYTYTNSIKLSLIIIIINNMIWTRDIIASE